ncbi:MAG: hypothetical protein AAB853_00585 [Patescibacteria group bacterium]
MLQVAASSLAQTPCKGVEVHRAASEETPGAERWVTSVLEDHRDSVAVHREASVVEPWEVSSARAGLVEERWKECHRWVARLEECLRWVVEPPQVRELLPQGVISKN